MMVIGGGNMGKKLSKEIPTQGSHSPLDLICAYIEVTRIKIWSVWKYL